MTMACLYTPIVCVGMSLSSGTAAHQRPPSEHGIQKVIEEVTSRDKIVYDNVTVTIEFGVLYTKVVIQF